MVYDNNSFSVGTKGSKYEIIIIIIVRILAITLRCRQGLECNLKNKMHQMQINRTV